MSDDYYYEAGESLFSEADINETLDLFREMKEPEPEPVVCECGSEKLKLPHSDWCPKVEEE